MRIKIISAVLAMGLVLPINGSLFAQGKNEDKKLIMRTSNEVIGEISAMGKNFIALIYERDKEKGTEYEMLLPIDAGIKLEHKKNMSELQVGDTVTIQYEDTAFEDANMAKKMERKAQVISFVRAAVKKPEPPHPPEPGD